MLHLVEPFDLVVHNQSTECFVILLCHNTFAKSYDSKVGLITQKRCIPVTVFAALLLPILLYYCCRFCCTAVTIFAAFLDAGYRMRPQNGNPATFFILWKYLSSPYLKAEWRDFINSLIFSRLQADHRALNYDVLDFFS